LLSNETKDLLRHVDTHGYTCRNAISHINKF